MLLYTLLKWFLVTYNPVLLVLSLTRALRGLRVAPLTFGVAVDARTELPLTKETKNAKQQKKNKKIYISSSGGGKKRGFGNQKMTKRIFVFEVHDEETFILFWS